MKKKTRLLALALTLMMLAVCVPAVQAEGKFTAGTYTAKGKGNNGDIAVSVTFSVDTIIEVTVEQHSETAGLADPALERIPTAIVEGQTLAVDAISGATNTSKAILQAVEDCVKQAGGDIDAMKAAAESSGELKEEQLSTDVVIVGAGIAGIMAAYEFKYEYPDVDYIVLEKLDVTTGSLPTTGGLIAGLNSKYHEVENVVTTTQDIAELFAFTSKTSVNAELIDRVFAKSDVVLNNLIEWGAPFIPALEAASVYSDRIFAIRTENRGAGLATFLQQKVVEDGLSIRTGTETTELIVEDGVVKGVIAQDKDTRYEIKSDYVLLATGGFGTDRELVAEFCPVYKDAIANTNAGATGDGIKMTRQFNTKVVGEGAMGAPKAMDGNDLVSSMFLVNAEGKRFINESEPKYVVQSEIVYGQDLTAYYLVDANYTKKEQLQAKIDSGLVVPYNSLEEMADALGMNKDVLLATVEAYNKAVDAGENPEFGLPVGKATKLETPPYYADKVLHRYFGTIPGIEMNLDCQVLDGNGAVVPNLYAAGELTAGNAFSYQYPGSGMGIAYAANTGRLAAEIIAVELSK